MRLLLKLSEQDWEFLSKRYPNKKDILNALIIELRRLQRVNPNPPKQIMTTKDFIIPEEFDDYLIKISDAEGMTVTHFIKKEIIYPSL